MSIDLHCHTRFSDGSTPLPEVLTLASLRGVTTLAITDHDTMEGCASAVALGETVSITVIPGVEISAADPKRHSKAHILCYAPKHPERILPLLQKTTDNRHAAMLESIEKVVRLYPVTREMILRRAEGSTNIYKQHVMQALMDAGYASEMFGDVFRRLYDSKTGLAYVRVAYPTVQEVLDAIREAEGLAVLAHPSEYHNMELLEELCKAHQLDGVEIHHPRNLAEDQAAMHELAKRYHLAETGGTDFHGFYTTRKNPVGAYTTTQAEFDRLFSARKDNV
ncbi:PHP domain-containing protein [Anaeromassilibacillus senegalensis]|uniref:PHP domain-containing protein n=1 Tax=Anaeromassilibacillus senegalensis TaxID=1673717 RepID=A0ABS9CNJ0_9FIRM|nr:PHP domain-containing protein [Anaeromassilibacillus senegalensis]MCF2651737.1 PHP domain-containing protein [Anaeromassilibacillus senegalensis]